MMMVPLIVYNPAEPSSWLSVQGLALIIRQREHLSIPCRIQLVQVTNFVNVFAPHSMWLLHLLIVHP